MKQIAQNYKSGELAVLDVPAPGCRPGGVLVRSLFSLISTGTEMMKVTEAKMSLVGKARARPDQVRKVLDSVAAAGRRQHLQEGDEPARLLHAARLLAVRRRRRGRPRAPRSSASASWSPRPGNEYALHAEYNWVPVNLCVPVPDGVAPEHAAFATVGAIAMQGVRQAEVAARRDRVRHRPGPGRPAGRPAAGRRRRAGRRPRHASTDRCRLAEKAGAVLSAAPTEEGLAAVEQALARVTGGLGADHVLLAAGGASNGPVEAAARLARDRARVVDIGKTRLDLPWNAYYDKELDVRFSRSYGPGRYDDRYELEGIDYPAGYVRWTERRNLACFLDLIAAAQLEVGLAGLRHLPARARPRRCTPTWRPARWPGRSASCSSTRHRTRASEPPATSQLVPGGRPAGPRPADAGQLAGRASSVPATTRPPCCCRTWPSWTTSELAHVATDHVAVRGQRPAEVRLRHRLDRPRTPCSTTSRWTRSSS